jgi:hypothetical protein
MPMPEAVRVAAAGVTATSLLRPKGRGGEIYVARLRAGGCLCGSGFATSSRCATGLMLGAGFLALRVHVDAAEEFGKRVRA